MSYYSIGIGGTGARCIESLIYLCVLGLDVRSVSELEILLVDQNKACGNVEQVQKVLELYVQSREILQTSRGVDKIFCLSLKPYVDENSSGSMVWSPFPEDKTFVEYLELDGQSGKVRKLTPIQEQVLSLFSTPEEKKIELKEGFKGHPNIGSVIMGLETEKAFFDNGFFGKMKKNIKESEVNKVFVFSSVFGGMGAAGFPRLGTHFKKSYSSMPHFNLGGGLLLPYFSFNNPNNGYKGAYARAEDFMLVSKESLKFYSKEWQNCYDAIYVVGDDFLDGVNREFKASGRLQKNPAHYIELMTALGAFNFYASNEEVKGLKKLTRTYEDSIFFRDMPHSGLQRKMLYFTSFALAFQVFYKTITRDPERFRDYRKNYRWYVRHFMNNDLELLRDDDTADLNVINSMIEHYFKWLENIHECDDNGKQLRLLREKMFSDLDLENRQRDILFYFKGEPLASRKPSAKQGFSYTRFIEILNSNLVSPDNSKLKPVSKLTDLLYKTSVKFCNENYNLKSEGAE